MLEYPCPSSECPSLRPSTKRVVDGMLGEPDGLAWLWPGAHSVALPPVFVFSGWRGVPFHPPSTCSSSTRSSTLMPVHASCPVLSCILHPACLCSDELTSLGCHANRLLVMEGPVVCCLSCLLACLVCLPPQAMLA